MYCGCATRAVCRNTRIPLRKGQRNISRINNGDVNGIVKCQNSEYMAYDLQVSSVKRTVKNGISH